MSTIGTRGLWVAHGTNGVVGSIRHEEDDYVVVMVGADAETGRYPSLEVAKGALYSHMRPGSSWPRYEQH
ncbi:methyltransferase [Microbacterium aerolatum]|uniref:Methyltransferase n=1 Tax=Microbacterium aerolatum TaxID=153731 RepID=A0A511AEY2_9MICO|nr:methyltransferase [Microbacterium aerolatum]MCK3769438.1 methyltransferase [Microbacterium aerolatum]GEK86718.1 hypothetical protein MAE01_18940 [Microbacterium aerolatum]GGB19158.1 hypothetical protein GCM10007198_07120 [Microbacterium aerolatum]